MTYPKRYNENVNTFLKSDEFDDWLARLKDTVGKAIIIKRIRSAEMGNFGDCAPVGEGVVEMRVHYGPGYRIYCKRQKEVIYFLLIGGDKSSQKRDVLFAKAMARKITED